MNILLAHISETHNNGLESFAHYAAPWYIALPVFLVATFLVAYLAWIVSARNVGTTLMILSGFLLFSGFTLYNVSAIVSGLAIVSGIMIAGFLAVASLSSN